MESGRPERSYNDNNLEDVKRHDGIPTANFAVDYLPKLLVALSKIFDGGHTMRSVALGFDTCGRNFVVPAVLPADWAEQQQKHTRRVVRLAQILLGHIDKDCSYYALYSRPDWIDSGDIMFAHFCSNMALPMDQPTLTKLNLQFDQLNWKSSGKIKLSRKTITRWAELVLLMARKLPAANAKTNLEIWNKFCSGCPNEIADTALAQVARPLNIYRVPALYPADHPLPGQANPQAGDLDIMLFAAELTVTWKTLISTGRVKAEVAEDETAFYGKFNNKKKGVKTAGARKGIGRMSTTRREMDDKSMCFNCGGLGHMARVKQGDTFVNQCPTKIDIDKDTVLRKIVFPHFDNPMARSRKEASNLNDEEEEQPEQCNESESDDDDDDVDDDEEETNQVDDHSAADSDDSMNQDSDRYFANNA